MVYIVDDDPALLRALGRLLRASGFSVTTSESADAFLRQLDRARSGCLILDLNMPGLGGLELQQVLSQVDATLAIIFLTGAGDISASVDAMKRGAVDFLIKPVDETRLLASVRQALRQTADQRDRRDRVSAAENRLAHLTPREREVLEHLLAGKLNKQVAADLGTVEKTIKVHRGRIMEKLQVRSVPELVRLCYCAAVRPVSC
jgi:FixJ family two-component response regulator